MNLQKHFDKNHLHHAYLLEGAREKILPEILALLKDLGIEIIGNPDFFQITLDSFGVEAARNLKSLALEKAFSVKDNSQKIFVISTNSFLLEAQNSLLKMFEEPITSTHFFLIVPDVGALLKTFISRFYFISTRKELEKKSEAEKFIVMQPRNRINFIKELLVEEVEDSISDESLNFGKGGSRFKALKLLNDLELTLHRKITSQIPLDTMIFEHLFKVRKFLRMPGSSAKTLMESVALIVPVLY